MPIPTGGRIIHLDFGNPACFNGSGTAVTDLSGSGNNWIFGNTNYTVQPANGGFVEIDITNSLGRSTDYTGFSYGTAAYTVVMWIQQNGYGVANYQMFYILQETGGAGSNNTFYWGTRPGGPGNEFFIADGTSTGTEPNNFPLNTWKMLAFVKPAGAPFGSTFTYIDGTLASITYGGSATMNATTGYPSYIEGVGAGAGFWNHDMSIGEFSFYNQELSPSDITDYYNSTAARYGLAPPPYVGSVGGRQFGQGFNG